MITINSDDYDNKCMKIKFNSDDESDRNLYNMIIVVRVVSLENYEQYKNILLW